MAESKATDPAQASTVSPATPTNKAAVGPEPVEGSVTASDKLFERAKAKAPHLDRAFLKKHSLDDDYLEAVAIGLEPPPPYNGPDFSTTDLHRTAGGWQITPAGVNPEDVGSDKIAR